MDDAYENLENYNSKNKRKVLVVFDNVTAETEANEKLSSILTELFFRGRKLNISLIFISQSYFKLPKTIKLKAAHYSLIKKNKTKNPRIATDSINSFV